MHSGKYGYFISCQELGGKTISLTDTNPVYVMLKRMTLFSLAKHHIWKPRGTFSLGLSTITNHLPTLLKLNNYHIPACLFVSCRKFLELCHHLKSHWAQPKNNPRITSLKICNLTFLQFVFLYKLNKCADLCTSSSNSWKESNRAPKLFI